MKTIQVLAGTAHIFDESAAAVEKAFVTKAIATVTRAEDPAGARKRATKRLRPCPRKASATETKINRTYSFNNKILEVVLLGQPLEVSPNPD